jgi:hypothetical protein
VYQSDWRPHLEALKILGCSRMGFWRYRDDGIIRPAVHYHRTGRGSRAPLMINVPACRLALQVHLGH